MKVSIYKSFYFFYFLTLAFTQSFHQFKYFLAMLDLCFISISFFIAPRISKLYFSLLFSIPLIIILQLFFIEDSSLLIRYSNLEPVFYMFIGFSMVSAFRNGYIDVAFIRFFSYTVSLLVLLVFPFGLQYSIYGIQERNYIAILLAFLFIFIYEHDNRNFKLLTFFVAIAAVLTYSRTSTLIVFIYFVLILRSKIFTAKGLISFVLLSFVSIVSLYSRLSDKISNFDGIQSLDYTRYLYYDLFLQIFDKLPFVNLIIGSSPFFNFLTLGPYDSRFSWLIDFSLNFSGGLNVLYSTVFHSGFIKLYLDFGVFFIFLCLNVVFSLTRLPNNQFKSSSRYLLLLSVIPMFTSIMPSIREVFPIFIFLLFLPFTKKVLV